MKLPALIVCLGVLLAGCAATPPADEPPPRRNVVLFLGDGMGVSTVTAARILAGQLAGQSGEEHVLPFETFPHLALIKTYETNSQVADSAGTMSAIVTGKKTSIGYLSVPDSVGFNDCEGALANQTTTLLDLAERAGLATGIVSTARITHATPAANFAHVPNRNWESDADLPELARGQGCTDIARQLVDYDEGDGIEVVLGGGRRAFLPADAVDPEYPERSGGRGDGVDLVAEWQARRDGSRYVWDQAGFDALDPTGPGPVLGLFEPSHMQWEADRAQDAGGEPSLAAMTEFALRRLDADPDGFYLVVEGGRIDHGHHAGNAYRALTDTLAMADAVQVAMEMTDPTETLILVTADHSHTLTISGYPRRGNPILGLVESPIGGRARDAAGRPYTTLGYANGPGYRNPPEDFSDVDVTDRDFRQPAAVPMASETHAGEDVAAYARGPNATALGGVMEQNRLYDVMYGALFGTPPKAADRADEG